MVVAAVAEHLLGIAFGIVNLDIGNLARSIADGGVDGVDEALVRSDVELGVTVEDLLVEGRVDLDGVFLYEFASGGIVAVERMRCISARSSPKSPRRAS